MNSITELEIQSRLKPCPFCGNTYIELKSEWEGFHKIIWLYCPSCSIRTSKHFNSKDSIEELVNMWNSSGVKKDEGKRIRFYLLLLPLFFAQTMKDIFVGIEEKLKGWL